MTCLAHFGYKYYLQWAGMGPRDWLVLVILISGSITTFPALSRRERKISVIYMSKKNLSPIIVYLEKIFPSPLSLRPGFSSSCSFAFSSCSWDFSLYKARQTLNRKAFTAKVSFLITSSRLEPFHCWILNVSPNVIKGFFRIQREHGNSESEIYKTQNSIQFNFFRQTGVLYMITNKSCQLFLGMLKKSKLH